MTKHIDNFLKESQTEQIIVSVTPSERLLIEQAAWQKKRTVSEWIGISVIQLLIEQSISNCNKI